MKSPIGKFGIVILLLLGVVVTDCSKKSNKGVLSDDGERDTTYVQAFIPVPQQRVVLVEEFTGVYCYTCPLAHAIVKEMQTAFPEKIAAINIHSHLFGIYDDPRVMDSKYDFRTVGGDSIVELLGGVASVPSAAIDRTSKGEFTIISKHRDEWMGQFEERLKDEVSLNIKLSEKEGDASTIDFKVEIQVLKEIGSHLKLNIAIVEDEIIDKQFVDDSIVDNYVHQHILRRLATDPSGNNLERDPLKGMYYRRFISTKLDPSWNRNNLSVIVWVNEESSLSAKQASILRL